MMSSEASPELAERMKVVRERHAVIGPCSRTIGCICRSGPWRPRAWIRGDGHAVARLSGTACSSPWTMSGDQPR